MVDRPTIDVATPAGGWGAPWPNVAEIEAVLSHDKWTLVGGLMAQLHAGIGAVRPTNDVDIVLHVETTRGIASETARALESLGYELSPSIDDRDTPPTGSNEGRRRPSMRSSPCCSSEPYSTSTTGWNGRSVVVGMTDLRIEERRFTLLLRLILLGGILGLAVVTKGSTRERASDEQHVDPGEAAYSRSNGADDDAVL